MAVIYAPNKEYTGISAGVPFFCGKGKTDNPQLIAWFQEKGYYVEQSENVPFTQKKENNRKTKDSKRGV